MYMYRRITCSYRPEIAERKIHM